jgi:hypothetical protein
MAAVDKVETCFLGVAVAEAVVVVDRVDTVADVSCVFLATIEAIIIGRAVDAAVTLSCTPSCFRVDFNWGNSSVE